jgi:MFS family permease
VLSAAFVSRVVLLLVGGVVADRLPRQSVMLGADLLRTVSQGLAAALLITGHARVWELVVLIALFGAGDAFFAPASTGLIPETVRADRLQQANALMSLSRSMALVVGPTISGLLVAGVGPGWVFAIDAATFAVSSTSLARLRRPDRSDPGGLIVPAGPRRTQARETNAPSCFYSAAPRSSVCQTT